MILALQIIKEKTWYNHVPKLASDLNNLRKEDKNTYEREKKKIYDFFTRVLKEEKITLSEKGPNWDKDREPIAKIVIHHTSMEPGLDPERLSGLELVRLYALYYANPTYEEDLIIRGKGIYSGHFRNGKQVFWPYHWIVRKDGSYERLLNDNEIGWHCGNWDVNRESIAIVLDGDYEDSEPAEAELAAIAKIINQNYHQIKKENVLGHCEVNKNTICPSKKFLGKKGWKKKLLELL